MTLVVWINLWLRGGILSMCGKYKTLWKPNPMHYCSVVYAGSRGAPRLLWLVSHGGYHSPGYRHLIPWLCAASILQWVVLIASYFSVNRGVVLLAVWVSLPMKPSAQGLFSLVILQFYSWLLVACYCVSFLRVDKFPTVPFVGDSARKTVHRLPLTGKYYTTFLLYTASFDKENTFKLFTCKLIC